MENLWGSYTALITPFNQNGVDEGALRQLVNWQVEQKTHGLVVVGTTGESATLSPEEHQRVIKIAVEEVAGRIPVVAGAGANNPQEAIQFAQFAQEVGADAILTVAGYYNRPAQEGLYQHFKLLHDSTNIPMIIYNIPPRVIVDIQPETMGRLAELPRVIGVKDATSNLARITEERRLITKPFSYFSGDDGTALAYHAMGGAGCISVTSNVAPLLLSQFQEACRSGNFELARTMHEKLYPMHRILMTEPSPAGIKYAVSLLGYCREDVRVPIVPVRAETKQSIREEMEKLELI